MKLNSQTCLGQLFAFTVRDARDTGLSDFPVENCHSRDNSAETPRAYKNMMELV